MLPEISGIVCVDPSWKGMATIIYLPLTNEIYYYEDNILDCYNKKAGKKYQRKTMKNQVYNIEYIKSYFNNIPEYLNKYLKQCNIIVIEKQFKDNMKYLSFMVGPFLLERCKEESKIIYYSALYCKKIFNIPIHSQNYENKKRIIRFMKEGEGKNLIGALEAESHNQCDACLLLNTYLKGLDKGFIIIGMDVYVCPGCNGEARKNFVRKEGSRYFDQPFLSCKSVRNPNPSAGYNLPCCKQYSFVTMDRKEYNEFLLAKPTTDNSYKNIQQQPPSVLGKREQEQEQEINIFFKNINERLDKLQKMIEQILESQYPEPLKENEFI